MPSSSLNNQLNAHLKRPENADIRQALQARNQEYGVTMNIAGGYMLNRKRWEHYPKASQIKVLTTILNQHCMKNNVSISWDRYVLEECPTSRNMHIHCVVSTDQVLDITRVALEINKKYNPKSGDYQTFNYSALFSANGWETYIRKNCL